MAKNTQDGSGNRTQTQTNPNKSSQGYTEKGNVHIEHHYYQDRDNSETSRVTSNAEIQQCIIDIENIRKEYFDGIQTSLMTPIANNEPVNISHLQQMNIFTTWNHFQYLQKGMIYKDLMTDKQKNKIFRLHGTLMANILPNWQHRMVSNESVRQLLMGITLIYDNLEDTNNFQEQYLEVLEEYIGSKETDEEFLDYITRKKQELASRGDMNLFEPFQ